ncbi:tyrosyl-DNA phosphodiesterase-domain-containing protein [Dactylonectria macrodidyma]|uniref:Tyrosyl-DNA phosphodiesterase-domain-containing protein n=1 Tax=Dactylonectria macrodidyma TaxID=307937 RepID=A0A9P9FFQ3_9HYPO|nr:tyrosyl-DNA phosphodiesterase-domain-containing protein [Dactylonectria macrodidyma]
MERPQKRRLPDEESPIPVSLTRAISPPNKKRRNVPVISSPWQLTWVQDLSEDQNRDALTLKDLLGDPLISECWEFNFLHQISFLMNAFDSDTKHLVKVHIVHGFWKHEDSNRLALEQAAAEFDNVHLHIAPMPEMFGTHHSKMMILFRHDDTAQVIIHTANMIPKDWTNMTNAVWKSQLLPKLSKSDNLASPIDQQAIGSGERFKSDLLNYLRSYDRRKVTCKPLADKLDGFDFTSIRASLIASVPGTHGLHDATQTAWGWSALRNCLRCVPCQSPNEAEIVVQVSSIATLGAKDDWLQQTLFGSLSQSKGQGLSKPKFKVVFPTADEIRRSLDGYASGASIHTKIQSSQQAKQLEYLRPIFYHWANDSPDGKNLASGTIQDGGRQRAAPHVKTYIRYSKDSTDWALLTSANLSKQAWGEAARATGEFRIASWEIGVMVWPELLEKNAKMVATFQTDNTHLANLTYSLDPRIQPSDTMVKPQAIISSSPHGNRSVLGSSWRSGSPLAEQFLARDIAECSDDEAIDTAGDDLSESEFDIGPTMYRRASGVAYGGSRPVLNPQTFDEPAMTPLERKQSRQAERSLLRDNHVLPPKHPHRKDTVFSRVYRRLFSTKLPQPQDEERPAIVVQPPSETSPLLGSSSDASTSSSDDGLDETWGQAVADKRIRTTWQRETKTIISYSTPLIITFLLQYSINVTSIFAVGRIGKIELGAVSLANMSAAITCLAPFQGLATSLDTLCAQAYGSGHKHLVGLQFQRMTCFLFCLSVPVAVLWYYAENILYHIVPEPESARLAGLYLRVMIFSIPGFILFEGGKRFTQAQGLFRATTWVLVIVAPFNVFLSWFLVWHLGWGFVGAPVAVAVTENLLPFFLFLYVRFVDGRQCWGGFSRRALSNWWDMIRLALPGMIMVEAEWLAFEIMTLMSSRFGAEYLAAQSVLATVTTISYQIPFPMSIAASTRIANLIGAGLVDAAKTTGVVAFVAACIIGMFNLALYGGLRYYIPLLFTKDPEVIDLVATVIPIVAVMQVFDGLAAGAGGILRGIGKQAMGGPANLFAYYAISLPCSLVLAFGFDWRLKGLWVGVTFGTIA